MRRWLTFDLDLTLMQNPFMKYVFPEIEAEILARSEEKYDVIAALVAIHNDRMANEQYVAAYDWDDIVREHLEAKGISLSLDVEAILKKHCEKPKVYLLEESTPAVLKQLKERGYHLAVVTNGFYKYQYPVLAEIGISDFFDEIITPEIAGYGKPDVRILNSLLEGGEVVAHIGDRYDHDITMAKKFGTTSVLIDWKLADDLKEVDPRERSQKISIEDFPNPNLVPDIIINSIEELLKCFK